jgi:hypothetical protein
MSPLWLVILDWTAASKYQRSWWTSVILEKQSRAFVLGVTNTMLSWIFSVSS